jgi:hypothetical protein
MLTLKVPCFDEPPDKFYEWAKMKPDDDDYARLGNECAMLYSLNFPKRLTLENLAKKFRKQGSKFFASQQLLDVSDIGTSVFRKSWLDTRRVRHRDQRVPQVVAGQLLCVPSGGHGVMQGPPLGTLHRQCVEAPGDQGDG